MKKTKNRMGGRKRQNNKKGDQAPMERRSHAGKGEWRINAFYGEKHKIYLKKATLARGKGNRKGKGFTQGDKGL